MYYALLACRVSAEESADSDKEVNSEEKNKDQTVETDAQEEANSDSTEETNTDTTEETLALAEETPTQPEETAAPAASPHTGGHLIVIDPGHQSKGMSEKEPNGPGSSNMKAKVTGGTSGKTSGLTEYQLNLTIGLKLRDELVNRCYTVIMTRESKSK